MLPFMKTKRIAGLIISQRKPDKIEEVDSTEGDSADAPLESAAGDLNDAVKADDIKKIAAALRAAYEILDAEPHEEGPHVNEE